LIALFTRQNRNKQQFKVQLCMHTQLATWLLSWLPTNIGKAKYLNMLKYERWYYFLTIFTNFCVKPHFLCKLWLFQREIIFEQPFYNNFLTTLSLILTLYSYSLSVIFDQSKQRKTNLSYKLFKRVVQISLLYFKICIFKFDDLLFCKVTN